MSVALYSVVLPDGTRRLARGSPQTEPSELLPADLSLDELLAGSAERFRSSVASAAADGRVPEGSRVVAPVESQEVWGAGVTYLRSREAREEESELDASVYERVYAAPRPEVFLKSAGWRARGPGEPIAVRADSSWNTPEPELALVLTARMEIAGYTIGNDASSRSIEGDNPLYLPQAKIYDGACAIGPAIVTDLNPVEGFAISMEVSRDGSTIFSGETTTARMKRSFAELAACLGRAISFPNGAILMTGTGIVPEPEFTLEPGDVVRIRIDGLGVLENPVVEVGG